MAGNAWGRICFEHQRDEREGAGHEGQETVDSVTKDRGRGSSCPTGEVRLDEPERRNAMKTNKAKLTLPCWSCYCPVFVTKARLAKLCESHELPLCSSCFRARASLQLPFIHALSISDLVNLSEHDAENLLMSQVRKYPEASVRWSGQRFVVGEPR
jgi:hypothetical protein